jgi:NAD(P) transhydrogenase subunit alpha
MIEMLAGPTAPPAEALGLTEAVVIFVLAMFVGLEIITKVPTTLHTPLMSGSNAISGITIIGAIGAAAVGGTLGMIVGTLAVAAATTNVVGGYLVTDRMLRMFRRGGKGGKGGKGGGK